MFHKNARRPMIRAGGTIFYSLSYINARRGYLTKIFVPSNLSKDGKTTRQYYKSTIRARPECNVSHRGWICNAGWPPHPSLNLSPTLKKLGLFFEGGPSCSRLCIWKTHKKENPRGRGGSYDQFGILQKTKPKLKKRNPLHS